MAKEVLELEVKSNIKNIAKDTDKMADSLGDVNKEAKDGIGNFQVMGVSLNGVKAGFAKAAVTAKGMFGSIKAGLISTGIGAFLIAIGSLVAYFTSTKEGADKLDRAFKAIGATMDVLKDRLSDVGEAISLVFQGKWSEAADKLKDSVTGIVAEVVKEVKVMDALEIRLQKLRDAELAFTVQKAKTRQEIEKARLNAEDETKSASERLEALKKALSLEEQTTNRELELAREKLAIQDEQMKTSKNLVEDEALLAQFRVELIEKETASVKMRRRVVTEVNALEREILTEQKTRAKEKQDLLDAEKKALQDIIDLEDKRLQEQVIAAGALIDEYNTKQLSAIEQEKKALREKYQIIIDGETEGSEIRLQLQKNLQSELADVDEKAAKKNVKVEKDNSKKQVKWAEMTADQKMDIASSTANALSTILGEETAAGKAAAIIQATINTYKSATAAYASLAGIPVVGPVLGGIAAAAAVAAGIANVKAISSAGGGGGGGGGGINAPTPAAEETPAPQMMSGEFDLTGGKAPEPIKSYVVTDEMTNSQNQLANIRRRATI